MKTNKTKKNTSVNHFRINIKYFEIVGLSYNSIQQ